MTFGAEIIEFYRNFIEPADLPDNLVIHNPFADPTRRKAIETFYGKYFSDELVRVHVFGINPSRLTPTASGVHYTDGFALANACGIDNEFSKNRELTSDFFYRVVEKIGGSEIFYSRVFPWAAMPMSVTNNGKYSNHYDKEVNYAITSIVKNNVSWVSKLPSTGRMVILGKDENRNVLERLEGFPFGYNDVRVLPHPRWVMQYNRKYISNYIEQYVDALT